MIQTKLLKNWQVKNTLKKIKFYYLKFCRPDKLNIKSIGKCHHFCPICEFKEFCMYDEFGG